MGAGLAFVFAMTTSGVARADDVVVAPPPPSGEPARSSISTAPIVTTAIGVAALAAGAVALLTAPEMPRGCPVQDDGKPLCVYFDPLAMEGGGRDRSPMTREPTADEQIDRAARQDSIAKAETRNTIGLVALIAGGVITAGGLTWLFLDSRSSASSLPNKRTAIRATPRAFSLSWRF